MIKEGAMTICKLYDNAPPPYTHTHTHTVVLAVLEKASVFCLSTPTHIKTWKKHRKFEREDVCPSYNICHWEQELDHYGFQTKLSITTQSASQHEKDIGVF